ncbi:hypothetical protein SAMN05216351_101306 [Pseudobutyrivibrio sp. JW11]|uniref:hypothetical protein n=1 Tax=Pseudobutyrivibrio sp. JW11 TaxID=1855302 RepID=UPI0008EAF70C|nr:hypothetical protein [Pseudobutyrivibrio sp. JW11]SFN83114.1 hypothetical protein SAMN05216351_101306 [Pseudobutyrivibrio sp. JW11]
MRNNQLLPFERNRYYTGKMLTSVDFEAEQTYMNNKRRFLNNMMFGSGVVCGLNVVSLDDLSLLIESGVAIDGSGREIVVESSVVKKLSAIEDFDKLSSDEAYLCIRYKEEPVHAVYSLNQTAGEQAYEFNRMHEGYELFLKDASDEFGALQLDDEFYRSTKVYENDDVLVELSLPAENCAGIYSRIRLSFTGKGDKNVPVAFQGILQMPVFTTSDGNHEMEINIPELKLNPEQVIYKDFWIKAENNSIDSTELILKETQITIFGEQKRVTVKGTIDVSILKEGPESLAARNAGKLSLEMRNATGQGNDVTLAKIKLVKTDMAYIIDQVIEADVKKYITIPQNENLTREYTSNFAKEQQSAPMDYQNESGKVVRYEHVGDTRAPQIASGIVEIPLGDDNAKGTTHFSGEVLHGLGKGNVYVDVGFEVYDSNSVVPGDNRSTIYGAANIFRDKDNALPNVDVAVKVLNDKGSFIVGATLLENVDQLILSFRWTAIKFPTEDDFGLEQEIENISIAATTPTVVLGFKDNYFFDVEFTGIEKSGVTYELTEPNSGEITSEGVYTAPNKEGVYEIRISLTDIPVVCTYAYAIVKKDVNEKQE